jgi:hypothetical protein
MPGTRTSTAVSGRNRSIRWASRARRSTPLILIAFVLVVGVVIGFATGGSLRHFPSIRLRAWWFAIAGIALQFVNPSGALGHLAVAASFALLLIFAVLNIEQPGLLLFAVGVALNALVVIANGGMPITREAVVRSDQESTLPALESGAGGAKHHLADDGSVLLILGDVTGVPAPIGAAVSVGDLVLYAGIAWFVAASMRPGTGEPQLTSRARNTSSATPASTTAHTPSSNQAPLTDSRTAWD